VAVDLRIGPRGRHRALRGRSRRPRAHSRDLESALGLGPERGERDEDLDEPLRADGAPPRRGVAHGRAARADQDHGRRPGGHDKPARSSAARSATSSTPSVSTCTGITGTRPSWSGA
jgi:hypothetical protein